MLFGVLVLIGIVAGVSLIAGTIAAVSRVVSKSNALSVALGTLTIPALLCASFGYWVLTMEVDDAAPGAVLMGNLTALAIVTPIALLASRCTIKFLSRRALRNVR
jgi:xanthine/uracil/vitamin C permease (AzgA family)